MQRVAFPVRIFKQGRQCYLTSDGGIWSSAALALQIEEAIEELKKTSVKD